MPADTPQDFLAWLDALREPTRLRLLRLLEKHELGVAELADVLQAPQSTISRHLKALGEQGWLAERRVGTAHLSTLRLNELPQAQRALWELARRQTKPWATARQDDVRLQARLAQRDEPARRFFAGAAGAWDALRRTLYGDRFALDTVLALLPPKHVVADLGCGTGQLMETLAPHVARVVGVDHTPAMLAAARQRLAGVANAEVLEGELDELPIEDGTLDAAVVSLALSYVAEPAAVLAEAARALKPDGRVVVVDVLRHDRDDFRRETGQARPGFEPEALAALLADAGFRGARVRALPPAADAKGPALFVATASS